MEVKAIFLCLLTLCLNLISSHLLASSPLFLPTSPFVRVDYRHPTHTEPLDTTLIPRGKRSVFTSSTTLFFWETADRMVEEVRTRRVALWSPACGWRWWRHKWDDGGSHLPPSGDKAQGVKLQPSALGFRLLLGPLLVRGKSISKLKKIYIDFTLNHKKIHLSGLIHKREYAPPLQINVYFSRI